MRTFTLGQLEIDILRHVRVDGSRFPTSDPTAIADYFVVEARWQGAAIDFYPNQGRPHEPLAFGFVGRKSIPVYEPYDPTTDAALDTATASSRRNSGGAIAYRQVGTKRGGDFRTRFFRLVAYRLGKALLAQQLGKTISEVTSADEAGAGDAVRRLLIGDFPEPAGLKQLSIDDAARFMRDAAGRLTESGKPPGTIVSIDCDFDSYNDGASEFETDTIVQVNVSGKRAQFRFPLTSIPTTPAINDSSIQFNVISENVEAGEGVAVHAYNGTGDDDPNADNGSTKNTRSIGGTALVALIDTSDTGSKTADLGATADGQILGNISSPGFYSLGFTENGFDLGEVIDIEAIENAGTDPATLTIDYTTTATITSMLDEVSAALNVNQRYLTTVDSDLDEVTASLNAYKAPSPNIAATVDEIIASLSVQQSQRFTVAASVDELTASFSLNVVAVGVRIEASVDELTDSLEAVMLPQLTLGATLDEVSAALAAGQTDYLAVNSQLDELTASLNAYMQPGPNIAATVDELLAGLSVQQPYRITVTSILDELTALLAVAVEPRITIAALLDEFEAVFAVQRRGLFSQDHIGGRVTPPPPQASIGGRVSRVQDARGRFNGPPPTAGGRRISP